MGKKAVLFTISLILLSACCLHAHEDEQKTAGDKEVEIKQASRHEAFTCGHCGLAMSVTDLEKECTVCRCKRSGRECKEE